MDYQPMGPTQTPVEPPIPASMPEPISSPMPPTPAPAPVPAPAHGHSSVMLWSSAVVIIVIVAGLAYFLLTRTPAAVAPQTQDQSAMQAAIPALTGGNTTADITSDLNQVPDTSAALNADAAAAATDIQSL